MKRRCSWWLSVLLLQGPLATAAPTPLPTDKLIKLAERLTAAGMPRAFQALRRSAISTREFDTQLNKIASFRSVELSAHVGQALIFILTVTGVDLVYQEIKKDPLTATHENLPAMAAKAAAQVLNSGSTWTALAGASASGLACEIPASVLAELMANPLSRPLLFESLRMSILSTASFLGWDAGAQLWKDATYLLEDPQDFARASSLFGVGSGALQALLFSKEPRNERDLKIARSLFANLLRIALFDQELRSNWLDRTWRTRIMSGDFVTLLTSIATASAVGSIAMPGGGTLVGFMFGLGGAAGSLIIPNEIKDGITGNLQDLRSTVVLQSLRANLSALDRLLKGREVEESPDFLHLVTWRHRLRSRYLTIHLERVRLELKELFRDPSLQQASVRREGLRASFREISSFIADERLALTRRQLESSAYAHTLAGELNRLDLLEGFLGQLGSELDRSLGPVIALDFKTLSETAKELIKYVEVSYANTFDEDKVIEAAG